MIKDKKEIQSLINRYKSEEYGIKALGFISYHNFDRRLIEEDYESINDFFRENFDLNHRVIKYRELLSDSSGKTWLEINTIFDLELLDELIAFGIASKVLNENLQFRYDELLYYMELMPLINENPENLEHYTEEEYLDSMKRFVLPCFKLEVSNETLARYKKAQLTNDYSLERKKELLISWWDHGMKNSSAESTRTMFLELLDSQNINALAYLILNLDSRNATSQELSESIKRGSVMPQILMAGALYYHSTPEVREEIDAELKKMFDKFNGLDQKKKRLS